MKLVSRPWGTYKIIESGDGFQIKKIMVHPQGILSLQSHKKRSEHWTIVQGTANIELDGKKMILNKNESIFIPVESVHRVSNTSDSNLIFIEVQIGDYLGEDDIIRYADAYNRQISSKKEKI